MSAPIVNAFTVDVEDYFHVSAFERHIRRDRWQHFECRVVANTHRILHMLQEYGVRGTFFVLGWVAHRYPRLVRDIQRGGHEIGSHGYWHQLVYEQSPAEFRADVQHARDLLQDIVGKAVTAYRAPSFSITNQSLWALEILADEGFEIDSSIFPIHHDRYGIPDAKTHIRQLSTAAGPLWEVPPTVTSILGIRVPLGGGYFRAYPWSWTRYCLRRVNHNAQQPFLFYIHPWELDPGQPRIHTAKLRSQFRHYLNLRWTEPRLHKLLRTFRLATLTEVIQQPCVPKPPLSLIRRANSPVA